MQEIIEYAFPSPDGRHNLDVVIIRPPESKIPHVTVNRVRVQPHEWASRPEIVSGMEHFHQDINLAELATAEPVKRPPLRRRKARDDGRLS